MDLKWTQGGVPLGSDGFPEQVDGLEEALQNAALALNLPRGSLPYAPTLGSGLYQLDPKEENSSQRAWSMGEEALMGFPGFRVTGTSYDDRAGMWDFTVETPLGTGHVKVPGKEAADGEL
ncbi:MAG: hypothetical protein ACOYJZ_06640 [Acutalibacter sp.]|jgi:hypothetical protein